MRPACRLHDKDSMGDSITTGSPNVFINNLPETRLGDLDNCPLHIDHMVEGSPNVFTNNRNAVRVGDADLPCGDKMIQGSPDTFINE